MTTRRNVFGLFAASLAVLPAKSAKRSRAMPTRRAKCPAKKDKELIIACHAFHEADDAAYADEIPEADLESTMDTWYDALETVADLRPKTPEGVRAKAFVVLTAFQRRIPVAIGDTVEDKAEDYEYAAWRLLHEMLEVEGT